MRPILPRHVKTWGLKMNGKVIYTEPCPLALTGITKIGLFNMISKYQLNMILHAATDDPDLAIKARENPAQVFISQNVAKAVLKIGQAAMEEGKGGLAASEGVTTLLALCAFFLETPRTPRSKIIYDLQELLDESGIVMELMKVAEKANSKDE